MVCTGMNNLREADAICPYCGETITMEVDCSVPVQEYIEDCSVCCRPIVVSVATSPGQVDSLTVRTEDD
jgi:hypothetical protein